MITSTPVWNYSTYKNSFSSNTYSTTLKGATSYLQVSTENSHILVQQISEQSIGFSQERKLSLVSHSSRGQVYEVVFEVFLTRPVHPT